MRSFSLKECVNAPLLLAICLGFVGGIRGVAFMLLDALKDTLFPQSVGWASLAQNLSRFSGGFDTYVSFFIFDGPGSLLIALICYILGRIFIRSAQIVAVFILVAMLLDTAMGLYRTHLSALPPIRDIHIVSQRIAAELTAICVCAVAWRMGYRRSDRSAPLQNGGETSLVWRRKAVWGIVAAMLPISAFGWATITILRAL